MSIAMLIDLDGTIYRGNEMIPGADQFIETLKKRGITYMFVTNNSSRTPEAVADHLCSIGIDCGADEVYTTAQAAASYAVEHQLGRRAYVVGETGLVQALASAGIEKVDERPDFVIQGIDRNFHYETLKNAVGFIREGCPYVLTNPDLKLPSESGFLPGAGAIAAAIQAAAQVDPILIGKPSPIIMRYALKKAGMSPQNVWVIGDSIRTDIAAGHAVGCRTALVMTGVTNAANLEQEAEQTNVRPDVLCETLNELLKHISI